MEDSIFEGTESFSVSLLRTDSSLGITLARPHARVEIIDNDGTYVDHMHGWRSLTMMVRRPHAQVEIIDNDGT